MRNGFCTGTHNTPFPTCALVVFVLRQIKGPGLTECVNANIRRVYILCFRCEDNIHTHAYIGSVFVELKLLKQNNDLFVLQRLQSTHAAFVQPRVLYTYVIQMDRARQHVVRRFTFLFPCVVRPAPAIVSSSSTLAPREICKYPYYFVRCARVRHFRGGYLSCATDGNYNVSVPAKWLQRAEHTHAATNRVFAFKVNWFRARSIV